MDYVMILKLVGSPEERQTWAAEIESWLEDGVHESGRREFRTFHGAFGYAKKLAARCGGCVYLRDDGGTRTITAAL